MLATYTEDFYAGMPALTVNNYGNGKAYYQAFRDDGAFSDMLVSRLLCECGINGVFSEKMPEGVTAHSRTDGKNTYIFIQNFTNEEKNIETERELLNSENNERVSGIVTLKAYETMILTEFFENTT